MRERSMTLDGALWRAPLAVHLFMFPYMSHPYRHTEAWRKRRLLHASAPLLQGVWRNPEARRRPVP